MKESNKILKYHLDLSKEVDKDFMVEAERIKKLGHRLSNHEKGLLLQKARAVVYKK